MVSYIFDVDGTLTPARLPIDPIFKDYFLKWIQDKDVYLISGSDYKKTVEQVGTSVVHAVSCSFNTMANVCYKKGKITYQQDWNPPKKMLDLLNSWLKSDKFEIRAGRHIEHRIGMINFSIVGRNCTRAQRKEYNDYDNKNQDRARYCKELMKKFPDMEASVGGQISIDIYPKGHNKGQVVNHIPSPIYFFGDKTMPGGNDYDLAKILINNPPNRVIQVQDWKETWKILKEIESKKKIYEEIFES